MLFNHRNHIDYCFHVSYNFIFLWLNHFSLSIPFQCCKCAENVQSSAILHRISFPPLFIASTMCVFFLSVHNSSIAITHSSLFIRFHAAFLQPKFIHTIINIVSYSNSFLLIATVITIIHTFFISTGLYSTSFVVGSKALVRVTIAHSVHSVVLNCFGVLILLSITFLITAFEIFLYINGMVFDEFRVAFPSFV